MTYIEPRFGALAPGISDWPEMPTVWATPGVSRAIDLDLGHDPLRPLDRGRVGQLHVEQQVALVLLGDEARGRMAELPIGQHQQAAVDQQDDQADPQQAAHQPDVEGRAGAEDEVEQAEEPAQEVCPAARSTDRVWRRAAAAGWRPGPG